jgi:hypothetical protein
MNRKTIVLIALPVALAMNARSQGPANTVIIEPRTSAPYHYIHIQGEMNVKLAQDETPGVTVRGTTYQTGNTVTMLRNDTLFIYQTNTRKRDNKTFLTVNVHDLVSLEVIGKTRVNCSGLVNTEYLTIRASEGAQIKLDVRAIKVDSRATGCGYIDLSGSTVNTDESTDECSVIDSHLMDVLDKRSTGYLCYKC